MFIVRPESPYVCSSDTYIRDILDLFSKNNGLPVYIVDNFETKYLRGIVSPGDCLRALASSKISSLDASAIRICNPAPVVAYKNDDWDVLSRYLSSERLGTIPILNSAGCLVRVACKGAPRLNINKKGIIGDKSLYLIAEVGVNHNGNEVKAHCLIDAAAEAGFDAVKFQHRSTSLYDLSGIETYDIGTQFLIRSIRDNSLDIHALRRCCEYAVERNIDVIITPFDEEALEEVQHLELPIHAIKIASPDLTNIPLIGKCIDANLPIIVSTGMSTESEIVSTISYLRRHHLSFGILHCNSTYPTPQQDVRLAYIDRLKELSKAVVGYSSHDGSKDVPLAAIARGADIVEIHITEGKDQPGTDHSSSLEISELTQFVVSARQIKNCLGDREPRTPTQGEVANRIALGKSIGAKRALGLGHIITLQDICMRSPQVGFLYQDIDTVIGKEILEPLSAGQIIRPKHICSGDVISYTGEDVCERDFSSIYRSGMIPCIPVRYHDADELTDYHCVKALEFHMSSRDLGLDPAVYLKNDYSRTDLFVHAVEQYEDGFILDLAAVDSSIRKESRYRIAQLIEHLETLRMMFKPVNAVPVIINVGGFTPQKFADSEMLKILKENAVNELEELRTNYKHIEFLPQTMPPFPWHQGGMSHHNLLTSSNSLTDFINISGFNICLDFSHTFMACKFYSECPYHVIATLAPYVRHIHLSDSKGLNGEGLDIGLGEIDFSRVVKSLKDAPIVRPIGVVPEIWNGHYNKGERFARALNTFNRILANG